MVTTQRYSEKVKKVVTVSRWEWVSLSKRRNCQSPKGATVKTRAALILQTLIRKESLWSLAYPLQVYWGDLFVTFVKSANFMNDSLFTAKRVTNQMILTSKQDVITHTVIILNYSTFWITVREDECVPFPPSRVEESLQILFFPRRLISNTPSQLGEILRLADELPSWMQREEPKKMSSRTNCPLSEGNFPKLSPPRN